MVKAKKKETLEEFLVTENLCHTTYNLRGVVNEVVEYLDSPLGARLDMAMSDFARALETWIELQPQVEIEEIEEVY